MKHCISCRQLLILSFVSMLSPFLRLLPGSVAAVSGSAAWVSAAFSLLPAGLLLLLLQNLFLALPSGSGLADALVLSFGEKIGKTVLVLWSLWLIFHSGFLLRSGADRFIATVYHGSKPTLFILLTLLLCTIAAMGSIQTMARTCQIFCPLLLFVILLVLVFTLQEVEPTFLLPVTKEQTGEILKGMLLCAEPIGVVMVNAAFLLPYMKQNTAQKRHLLWLPLVCLLSTLFCAISVGSLGETVTAALPYPFFVMARDLSIVSGVERIEALVVALWLLPDFVLVTIELMIAAENLLFLTEYPKEQYRKRWVAIGTCPAAITAFCIAPNSQSLHIWSNFIVPVVHLGWAFVVVPMLLLVLTLRKQF